MTTDHYVDADGNYLGGYSNAEPPESAIKVDVIPADARQKWDGKSWSDIPVESSEVDAERDRRIEFGVEFNGKLYQSRATDRENIAGAAQLAFMAVAGGAKAGDMKWADDQSDFAWIAADNSLVPMDAQTTVALGKAAASQKQAMIFAARNLKNMNPIPQDYTDDKWWP